MADPDIPEQLTYTQTFTVNAEYQRSLSKALYLSQFRAAGVWILIGVMLLFLGVSILGRLGAFALVWVVLILIVWGLRYLRVRSTVRATFPIGRVMRSGFTATHFGISDGENSSVVAYSTFDSIEAGSGVVWMRRASPRRRLAYPRALFPDTEVERIRSSIASRTLPTIAVSSADSPPPTPGTPA